MNRREFLLLRTEPVGRVAELSCERLFMQYQHSTVTTAAVDSAAPAAHGLGDGEPRAVFTERTPHDLLGDVERELHDADVLRVSDTEWLTVETFGQDVEALLTAFRRRGGRVEYQPGHRS